MLNYCSHAFCSSNTGFAIGYSCSDFGYMHAVLLSISAWVDFTEFRGAWLDFFFGGQNFVFYSKRANIPLTARTLYFDICSDTHVHCTFFFYIHSIDTLSFLKP